MQRGRLCVSLLLLLGVLALVLPLAAAVCPSNGNTHAVYITSNMGANIWSFDTHGNYLGEVINEASLPEDVKIAKLRAMRFGPGGHLYVLSASGSYSRIFALSGNGLLNQTSNRNCTRNYLFTVATQSAENPFLDHPYDLAFHPETGELFVSNQNSITVTKYQLAKGDGGKGTLQWTPAPNVNAAMVERPAGDSGDASGDTGLFASTWSSAYALSSVRGIALSPRLPRALVEDAAPPGSFKVDKASLRYYLVVCDVSANMVHVFDPETGDRLFGIYVPSPIQVVFPQSTRVDIPEDAAFFDFERPRIYVSSKDDGMVYMIPFSATASPGTAQYGYDSRFSGKHAMYQITRRLPMHAASGIDENPSRELLLLGDRTGRAVYLYASPFASNDYATQQGPSSFLGNFAKQLPDQPEFILTVQLESQKKIPFCYELSPSGKFRYAALCTAGYAWSFVLMVALISIPFLFFYGKARGLVHRFMGTSSGSASGVDKATASTTAGEGVPLLPKTAKPNYGSME
ncbi:hypothetical protein STCU_06239 [Strigomonas culicis]|uniref:Mucin-associated surface protein (MASP) n=1 Tax=Strigomonas culicis TaxID=28005 RepID=S9VKE4_9TRYP|nr:hypothetical protein STCU_07570 [Strigomonas culicis]EPY26263.1 hypothetical protein STCU_06239 [Strigomonas culicis]|eukprot:EPY23670.1 hypothetical protein STCU_07570 [Strigomonas culicis]